MNKFEIHKFGGASIKDADSILNMFSIVKSIPKPCIVVFSAMGKMTNALENLTKSMWENDEKQVSTQWHNINTFYQHICIALNIKFELPNDVISQSPSKQSKSYDQLYDEVVSMGEILSTKLLAIFFSHKQYSYHLMDITKIFVTDDQYRKAAIDIPTSKKNLTEYLKIHPSDFYITQGFIGSTKDGRRTTLGRESSDYTATLLASMLNASRVTIWKDVDGIYDKDPKHYENSTIFKELTYQQAEKLALDGAQIIHPKTVFPLKDKGIPLYVKPFSNPTALGTIIH